MSKKNAIFRAGDAPARAGYPGLDRFRLAAALLVAAIHTSPLLSLNGTADFLLTRVAARVAEGILADFPAEGVTVCLKKPRAPIAADFAAVAVEITRWRES